MPAGYLRTPVMHSVRPWRGLYGLRYRERIHRFRHLHSRATPPLSQGDGVGLRRIPEKRFQHSTRFQLLQRKSSPTILILFSS